MTRLIAANIVKALPGALFLFAVLFVLTVQPRWIAVFGPGVYLIAMTIFGVVIDRRLRP